MNEQLEALLKSIIHPETEQNIVDSGFVDRADLGEDGNIAITLRFQKARDPFAQKIKRAVEQLMAERFPNNQTMVIIREAAPKPRRREQQTTTNEITHIIAIASGKGGVGKSTVTANLAIALRRHGCNVGILMLIYMALRRPRCSVLRAIFLRLRLTRRATSISFPLSRWASS